MTWQDVWQQLVPPFSAWYPNIFANFVWVPLAALAGYLWHRRRKRHRAEEKRRHSELKRGHEDLKQLVSDLHDTVRQRAASVEHQHMEDPE